MGKAHSQAANSHQPLLLDGRSNGHSDLASRVKFYFASLPAHSPLFPDSSPSRSHLAQFIDRGLIILRAFSISMSSE